MGRIKNGLFGLACVLSSQFFVMRGGLEMISGTDSSFSRIYRPLLKIDDSNSSFDYGDSWKEYLKDNKDHFDNDLFPNMNNYQRAAFKLIT